MCSVVAATDTERSDASGSDGLGVYLCVPYVALSTVLIGLAFASFMRHRFRNKLRYKSRGQRYSPRLRTFHRRCPGAHSFEVHGAIISHPNPCANIDVVSDGTPMKIEPGIEATRSGLQTLDVSSCMTDVPVTTTSCVVELPVTGTTYMSVMSVTGSTRAADLPERGTIRMADRPITLTTTVAEQKEAGMSLVGDLPITVISRLPVTDTTRVADLAVTDTTRVADLAVTDTTRVADLAVTDTTRVADLAVTDTTRVADLPVTDTTRVADLAAPGPTHMADLSIPGPTRVADLSIPGPTRVADRPVTGTVRHIWRSSEQHSAQLTVADTATRVDAHVKTEQTSVDPKERMAITKLTRTPDASDTQPTEGRSHGTEEKKPRRCLPQHPDQRRSRRDSVNDGTLTSTSDLGKSALQKVQFALEQDVGYRYSDTGPESILKKHASN